MPSKDQEQELAKLIAPTWGDPLRFVRMAFDWQHGDLAGFDGPDKWQTECLTNIRDAIAARKPGDVVRIAVKTGKGPGKTALEAWLILWLMSTRPNFAGFATANTADQLSDKLWRELALWHRRAINAHWFTWTATRFYANEAKETWGVDALPWRENNPDALGGLHNGGRGQCAIVDEGSGVPAPIYDVIDSTMTDPDSFVFVFGNPYRKSGRFYEIFTRFAHRWTTMTVDCRKARAPNQSKIAQDIEDWGLDSDYVKVNILGQFPETDSQTLIPLPLLESAERREVPDVVRRGVRPIWSVDVARFGDDRTTVAKRQGRVLTENVIAWRGLDTMQTAGRIKAMYDEALTDDRPSHIVVDVIGIGAGVGDRLREMGLPTVMLNVAESPAVQAKFAKRRDELWWAARVWFEGLDVSCSDKALMGELADVTFGYTSSGLIKVEGKQDTKERLGRSPDLADALIGTFAISPVLVERTRDRYERARYRGESASANAWAA